jgi:NADPH:quinone reductase-like Zn-dependent oxidoreductase
MRQPLPSPGPGEVQVQIAYAGVNFIDIYFREAVELGMVGACG